MVIQLTCIGRAQPSDLQTILPALAEAAEAVDLDHSRLAAVLDWVQQNHCIDETRVFVMGYSNGANFTSVLACERASAIAGVAIASGSLSCALPAAKPVILSHGLWGRQFASDPQVLGKMVELDGKPYQIIGVMPAASRSAEIKLLASGAIKEAYLELLPDFEKASGHKVAAAWSSTTDPSP